MGNEYEVGQRPPDLLENGSFQLPLPDVRGKSFIDDAGKILAVDMAKGVLIEVEEAPKE